MYNYFLILSHGQPLKVSSFHLRSDPGFADVLS